MYGQVYTTQTRRGLLRLPSGRAPVAPCMFCMARAHCRSVFWQLMRRDDFAGGLDRREQQGDQHADDGDDHQQLDERERMRSASPSCGGCDETSGRHAIDLSELEKLFRRRIHSNGLSSWTQLDSVSRLHVYGSRYASDNDLLRQVNPRRRGRRSRGDWLE